MECYQVTSPVEKPRFSSRAHLACFLQRAMDQDSAVGVVPVQEQLEAVGELLRDGKVKSGSPFQSSSLLFCYEVC